MSAGDTFLRAFHHKHPGCTSASLATGRDEHGRSSYDRLAQVARAHTGRIVDLGCGDGYLLACIRRHAVAGSSLMGIDMSPAELALARQRPALAQVGLVCAHARQLPVPDHSISCVVSHLAFMLMSEVESVVAELARVLLPGGEYAAIVGGGPRAGDAFEMFLDTFRPMYARSPTRVPRLGDMRARTEAGLAELFSPATGFAGTPDIDDFYLSLDAPPAQVWAALAPTYELDALSSRQRAGLEREFLARAEHLLRPDGTVPCTMAMRQVRCRTLGATDLPS